MQRFNPKTRTCRVVFNVTAATDIGETICVSGDHPLLGAWEEREAVELVTTPEYYPTWYSLEPVNLPLGETITYKYFIKSGGQFSRWESEEGDRSLTPQGRDIVVNEEIKTSADSATTTTTTINTNATEGKNELPQMNGEAKTASTTKEKTTTTILSTPPRSPITRSPVPRSPVPSSLASASPKTHASGSDTSEFEELQLDARDAVIIASVYLPVRVRRINNDANNFNRENEQKTTADAEETQRETFHIEWNDAALLSRPALFSRKLHVEIKDDHKMSYIGLIDGIDLEDITSDEQDDLLRQLNTTFRCTPIFLPKKQRISFWNGYCHKALWKLMHNWVDIYGERTSRWWDEDEHVNQYQSYLTVNATFARVIVEEYSEGDMIWLNGHELSLVSSYLLRKATTATIGIFIHTPFPSSEIFRTLVRTKMKNDLWLLTSCLFFRSYVYV
jgi:hypothetical protein